jgi:hypothetical protein
MSAYVVEDETINGVLSYLKHARDLDWLRRQILDETGCDVSTDEGCSKLGQAMFDLNCNAVEQRYGEGQAKEFRDLDYAWRYVPQQGLMQAYKSLGAWSYQCSEGDVPETRLLYSTMERVHAQLAHKIVSDLPAYQAAKW